MSVTALSLTVCAHAAAQSKSAAGPPRITVPEMAEVPLLDGTISDVEWRDAIGSYGFVNQLAPIRLNEREGRFWIGRKNGTIYIAIRTETPVESGILTRAKPRGDGDSTGVFWDDSIEIILSPNGHAPVQERTTYYLLFNAQGALDDWLRTPGAAAHADRRSWRIPQWTMKNSVHDGWWDVEVAIPLSSLGASEAPGVAAWGVNIIRNWKRPFSPSQWLSGDGYVDPESLPVVAWDNAAPVVQVLSLQEHGLPNIKVKVRNPHSFGLALAAEISDVWHRNQQHANAKSLKLAPGAETVLELHSAEKSPLNDHRTVITVTSEDHKTTYYYRQFAWNLQNPVQKWDIAQREAKKVVLQFKYYPYYDKIRAWVNCKGLNGSRVTGAALEVLKLGKSSNDTMTTAWRGWMQVKNGLGEVVASVPDLPDGNYRFKVTLQGTDVPRVPLVRAFVRKHFEWEHNQLGISPKVIPPFTPLHVNGSRLSSVLREYIHGSSGLWDQATSEAKELLTQPMRWTVQLEDGSKSVSSGTGWHPVSIRETEVIARSEWKAGDLRAQFESQYDYDGMMKARLTLKPCRARVKSLTLQIPLSSRIAKLMHACGDGLRHNYAGNVPAGNGLVWESSTAKKVDIVGTFYPYIWLGDGERGLAWFADTDRDWILDETTPSIDLVRDNGTLWLNVHFITKPGTIDRDHDITFGLQATPAKPMPEGWRRWTLQKAITGGRPVNLVGATLYWGADHYLPYPMGKDFSYFDEMRRLRESGKLDERDREFISNWMKKVAWQIPEDSEHLATVRRHVAAGMQLAAAHPWRDGFRMVAYTNARGIGFLADEFATFQDEWLNFDFFTRDWDRTQSLGLDVTPSRSLIDCLVWYYRKMLAVFDGVYWDNLYLAARHDPVVGDGTWTDTQNRVHPGLGLFALRQLVKRTAIMLHDEGLTLTNGRTPLITMGHMTNANIVPILSYLNTTFDWEWKYGRDDFQDRFSADLTVAESVGRQIGAWPTILGGGAWSWQPNRKNEWLDRNRLAVSLVNELWPSDSYLPQFVAEIYARLFAFGYGSTDCQVFNYWQDDNPVVVSSDTVVGKTLVITRPGAAIVVITDYGLGGVCRIKLDLVRLGLSAEASASNFETGKPFERLSSGEYRVSIPKHDMTILLIR